KWVVMVTWAGTRWPFRIAGSYRYSFKTSTAGPRKEGGTEITLTKFTSPDVPTTASIMTLPDSKSRTASMEANARTDLINFGGTKVPAAADGTVEFESAFAAERSAGRFSPSPAAGADFFITGCA